MVVVGEAHIAFEHEARFLNIDFEMSARTIVVFPSWMVAFEGKIGERFQSRWQQHGIGEIRFIRSVIRDRIEHRFGTSQRAIGSIKADDLLDRAAVSAAVEPDLDFRDASLSQARNYCLFEVLQFRLTLRLALGLAR